ncbi:lantibiotic dehydratase [bacterium SCSIO 12643]|nr:lantibiotic dehydratase [bacterium SCSIO 12643]
MKLEFDKSLIVRSPLLSFKESLTLNDLKSLFNDTVIMEAIFLSSPDLYNRINDWKSGCDFSKDDEGKLINTMVKYASRMNSRCTPFGLFAGCVVATFSEYTDMKIHSGAKKRSTRLDMNYTGALAQKIAKEDYILPNLKFYPNTSLYHIANKLRYVEYYYKGKSRIHQISSVDNSIYLQRIIDKSQSGATRVELIEELIDDQISFDDAAEFIHQVIESQILVSDLEPCVTGEESLDQILSALSKMDKVSNSVQLPGLILELNDVKSKLADLDTRTGNLSGRYLEVQKQLDSFNIPIDNGKLFQTDLYHMPVDSEMTITKNIQNQLRKTIEVLNYLTPYQESSNLKDFKSKFKERYNDQAVPLLKALDLEWGIGYAQNSVSSGEVNPLINDLFLPKLEIRESQIKWDPVQEFLLTKLNKALNENKKVVQVELGEVRHLKKLNYDDLPLTFSVKFRHLYKKERSDYLKIDSIGGSSGINLLGRFASSNQHIENIVDDLAKHEQKKTNAIIAEIVHLPENRVGNILMRPSFRDYEITYLCNSSLPLERQIKASDILVSIVNDRIVLQSRKDGRVIVPKLGNAHNYATNSMPVYHFLCDVQNQGLRGALGFYWGVLSEQFKFLPRVEIGDVVVYLATWSLLKKDYQDLCDNPQSISIWQEKWGVPNQILLTDGDNELYVNLKDTLSLNMFLSEIRKRTSIKFVEFLFKSENAIIKDEKNNSYTNELIATVKRKVTDTNAELAVNPHKGSDEKGVSHFNLGSEWLYYKIYTGTKTADMILTDVIKPLVEFLKQKKWIDSWFFIRYADPEHHLRLRFHLPEIDKLGLVISKFNESFEEYENNGSIWSIKNDVYERENSRYGYNSIHIAEQIFHWESECITDVIAHIEGDEGEEVRWKFAVRAVDDLIDIFKYTPEEKRDFMEWLKSAFAEEFGMDRFLKKQMDKKFREHRNLLIEVLDRSKDQYSNHKTLLELLSRKRMFSQGLVDELLEMQRNNELHVNMHELLASFIHMLLNRLFKSKQRVHEMVVYDFLWRTYRSEIARRSKIKESV